MRSRIRFTASLNFSFSAHVGIDLLGLAKEAVENRHAVAYLLQCQQVSFVAVVEVGGVVGDFVGQIDELGFERRPLIKQIFSQFGKLIGRIIVRVLDDAFAHFESEIQPAKAGVADFKIFDDAQRVQIVVEEESMLPHGGIERFFAGMAEGRMPDVVNQGKSLDQVHVEAKRARDGAGDLRHFEGVGQAIAEVVGEAAGEDLRLGFEAAKRAGVNDAVPVALEIVAIGMLGFRNSASAGLLHPHRVVGQHKGSLALSKWEASEGHLPGVRRLGEMAIWKPGGRVSRRVKSSFSRWVQESKSKEQRQEQRKGGGNPGSQGDGGSSN